jgi:hypothetical protein
VSGSPLGSPFVNGRGGLPRSAIPKDLCGSSIHGEYLTASACSDQYDMEFTHPRMQLGCLPQCEICEIAALRDGPRYGTQTDEYRCPT